MHMAIKKKEKKQETTNPLKKQTKTNKQTKQNKTKTEKKNIGQKQIQD